MPTFGRILPNELNCSRGFRAYLSIIKYFPSPPAIPIGLIKGFFFPDFKEGIE